MRCLKMNRPWISGSILLTILLVQCETDIQFVLRPVLIFSTSAYSSYCYERHNSDAFLVKSSYKENEACIKIMHMLCAIDGIRMFGRTSLSSHEVTLTF